MPVTSKGVQAVFCKLFCKTKELYKNPKTNKKKKNNNKNPPTFLFIDKALKTTKPQLKNSTEGNTVCSKLRVQFIKNWQAG